MATPGGGGERREGHGLEWREMHQGAHPGDQFVRLARHRAFRKLGAGRYEIRASGVGKPTGLTGLYSRLKRLIIGEPLATAAAGHERLTKLKALAVLSSDALSSVAYATEEIMRVLAKEIGRVLTHGHLLRSVMGRGYEDATGTLRVHIASLRKKLESNPARPKIIVTEPGIGYRLQVD